MRKKISQKVAVLNAPGQVKTSEKKRNRPAEADAEEKPDTKKTTGGGDVGGSGWAETKQRRKKKRGFSRREFGISVFLLERGSKLRSRKSNDTGRNNKQEEEKR